MSRDGWFDGKGFELFKNAYELKKKDIQEYWKDGKIDEDEIRRQREIVITKLKALEPRLDDNLHEALTDIFINWTLLDQMIEYNQKPQKN